MIPFINNSIFIAIMTLFAGCNDASVDPTQDPGSSEVKAKPPVDFNPAYLPIESGSFVQDKNFYFLTVLADAGISEKLPEVISGQSKMFTDALVSLNQSAKAGQPVTEVSNRLKFSDEKINEIGLWLKAAVKSTPALNDIVTTHLRPSGYYELYRELPNDQLVFFAWKDAAAGINNIFREYLEGEKPRDLESDGPLYNIASAGYSGALRHVLDSLYGKRNTYRWCFEPSLRAAVSILELNRRNEAGRFERLATGENKAAISHSAEVKWEDYTYGAIVLLGDAPNSPGDAENISKGRHQQDRRGRGAIPERTCAFYYHVRR